MASGKTSMTVVVALLIMAATAWAADVRIEVDCAQDGVELSPHLYGLFFEDINFAADGGLYAELVQNRSFEYFPVGGRRSPGRDYEPLHAWEKVERGGARCMIEVADQEPLNANNPHYLVVTVQTNGEAAGVSNPGFDGICLDKGADYHVSLYARRTEGPGGAAVAVALEREDGTVCARTAFEGVSETWRKFEGVMTPDRTTDNARLVVTTAGRGALHLDMVSLFPEDTFNGRRNGMRKDLAQTLKDLEPKFLRFPGGCVSHGAGLDNAYRWKDTVGDVAERKPNWNRWGYHQTYGLGFFEYFQLCEDLGATALPVIPVAVSCGFNTPYEWVPMDELQPWIDDALDLIEFANGPVSSEWGGLRARMGHPEPFNLRFVCLGNEEHDRPVMRERFPPFVEAIREAYPDIMIIGTSGLGTGIPLYDLMKEQGCYSSDEHYYEAPQWFIDNQRRFDEFERGGPKVFVGEYGSRANTLFNAVAEAAYLTGIERNGDLVDMACYAPLLAKYGHSQWHPDLIFFDNRAVVKTPNYYVQQLFSRNAGDVYLDHTLTTLEPPAPPVLDGSVGVGTWRTAIEVESVRVNGQPLDPSDWRAREGDFAMAEGLYVQTDRRAAPALSLSRESFDGEALTYEVRARKTGGQEGFLVAFGAADGRRYWWNVGGWGNARHGIQVNRGGSDSTLTETRGSIETDTWYDLKVALAPGRITCYLDGELVHDHELGHQAISVSTTRDRQGDALVVKLVNPTDDAVSARVVLRNAGALADRGTVQVLTGEREATNSREQPDRVKPETRSIAVGPEFDYTLPPYSVQFIRIERGG